MMESTDRVRRRGVTEWVKGKARQGKAKRKSKAARSHMFLGKNTGTTKNDDMILDGYRKHSFFKVVFEEVTCQAQGILKLS